MPRSIWTGSIAFGMVSIPIRLATAVRDKTIHFHMLSKDGRCRLRRKLYCPETGEEYDFKDTSRGYEVAPDQYVIIRDEELESVKPERGRTIEISDFVDLADIDPIYFDRSYLLLPDEGGAKAYHLLREAMLQTKRIGVARFVMRQHGYLAAIRPLQDALLLHTMHYVDEVTLPSELEDKSLAEVSVDKRELDMARQLVTSLTSDFQPDAYKNEYREQLQELIEAKAEGETITAVSETPDHPPPTYNLMEALKKSVEKAGGKKTKTKTAPRRTKRSKKSA